MTTTLDYFFTALGCYSSYLLIEQIKFDSKRPDLDIKENLERPLGYYTKMAEKNNFYSDFCRFRPESVTLRLERGRNYSLRHHTRKIRNPYK
ncbi:MAG TPA: hypothetical protein VJC39_04410 [Candidatus Nanoarchaeia archaeon]|nr:hypothetical protein [Candidatus Nanoarchaeia archaeon]